MFLFSVTFGLLPTFLDQKVIVKAAGILYLSGGIASFHSHPNEGLGCQTDGDFCTIWCTPFCLFLARGGLVSDKPSSVKKAAKEAKRDKLSSVWLSGQE
jgi:hypothetical protein